VSARARVPAIEGWYTLDAQAPALLGARCSDCGTFVFPPPQSSFCRNPACDGDEFKTVPLSRRGRIWSFTNACYQPPEPYVAADPYVPFAIAAVELELEKMVVLGQVVSGVGVEQLAVGMSVELVLETLYTDQGTDRVIWKWKPIEGGT
jgi:uncharacterized protein